MRDVWNKGRRISRRYLLQATAVAAATAALPARGDRARTRPNVLFILADDLGYGDLGVYGRLEYETPNIDALARRGVRMTQAYSNSALCTPTRVAYTTGRYPQRVHVGLEEPLRSQKEVGRAWAWTPRTPRCRRCCVATDIAPRSSASGTWATCRRSAR